jgi:hypothetical protein
MQTTSSVSTVQWGEEALSPTETLVLARQPGQHAFFPWVIAGPSAILHTLGVTGRGLYAARSFKRGDILGRYGGTVVTSHPLPTREEAMSSAHVQSLVASGVDTLMVVRNPLSGGKGWNVIDGSTMGPPYLQYVNDPRGTRLHPNCEVTEAGYVKVIATRIPAFHPDRPIQSELRFPYGDGFWEALSSAETKKGKSGTTKKGGKKTKKNGRRKKRSKSCADAKSKTQCLLQGCKYDDSKKRCYGTLPSSKTPSKAAKRRDERGEVRRR